MDSRISRRGFLLASAAVGSAAAAGTSGIDLRSSTDSTPAAAPLLCGCGHRDNPFGSAWPCQDKVFERIVCLGRCGCHNWRVDITMVIGHGSIKSTGATMREQELGEASSFP